MKKIQLLHVKYHSATACRHPLIESLKYPLAVFYLDILREFLLPPPEKKILHCFDTFGWASSAKKHLVCNVELLAWLSFL